MTTPRDDMPRPAPPSDVYAEVTHAGRTWWGRDRWEIEVVDPEVGWIPVAALAAIGARQEVDDFARRAVDAYLADKHPRPAHRVYGSGGPATGPSGPAGQARGA
jgi:hypothetical protein